MFLKTPSPLPIAKNIWVRILLPVLFFITVGKTEYIICRRIIKPCKLKGVVGGDPERADIYLVGYAVDRRVYVVVYLLVRAAELRILIV